MNIPKGAFIILDTLKKNYYEASVVGGCVRDYMLLRDPNDWDVCTSATPNAVRELFESKGYYVVPTGLKHGTVTVIIDGEHYEVTTYRHDGEYTDGRRPDHVCFTKDIMDDLSRRDFTINAMAYNYEDGLIDPFGGLAHLKSKTIAAVGDPAERFREDALRMLRAIRFTAQLDFDVDMKTFSAIIKNAYRIRHVSQERIRDELCKILMSDHPSKAILDLYLSGLMDYILPEFERCMCFEQHNPHHDKDVFHHTLSVIEHSPKRLNVRLAALLHDVAKPKTFIIGDDGYGHFPNHHMVGMDMAIEIMKRLKFDNDTILAVSILVKEHMSRNYKPTDAAAKRFIKRVGEHNLEDLFDLMTADTKGCKYPYDNSDVLEMKAACEKVLNEKQPMSAKDLAINGYDLMELGIKPSKQMGEILGLLLERVIDQPNLNTKEQLIDLAREMKK